MTLISFCSSSAHQITPITRPVPSYYLSILLYQVEYGYTGNIPIMVLNHQDTMNASGGCLRYFFHLEYSFRREMILAILAYKKYKE